MLSRINVGIKQTLQRRNHFDESIQMTLFIQMAFIHFVGPCDRSRSGRSFRFRDCDRKQQKVAFTQQRYGRKERTFTDESVSWVVVWQPLIF